MTESPRASDWDVRIGLAFVRHRPIATPDEGPTPVYARSMVAAKQPRFA